MIYAYGDDIPQLSLWIKRSKSADLDLLVELRRIELLSEKTLIGLSPGAGYLLDSTAHGRRQPGFRAWELFSV